MAIIGNSLAPYFTATTSDVFSANGTGTTFTLTRSISNLVDIEVLVNNIQQNPYNGAYSVNGTTLTFSEAPSAGANNVLVNYRQAVIGSTIPTPNTVASSSLQRDLTLGGNTTSNGTMFTQALVPTANITYDIGTSTLRYKDIYLSGSTINLGDVSLSASGNTFTVANSTGGTLPSSMGNTTIAGTANVTGDMTIGGNLTVTGTMTYINTTDLNIGDAIISLNADLAANIAPTEDAGININRGASTNAQFKWIESTDNWSLGNTTVSGILTSNDHVITGTANVSTGINVGANVNLSTSQINVGNATVNTVITSTSLSTNSVTITGGTANSVAYLNASKVVTTGSALTFDGTHLGVGGIYSGYGANYPTIQAKGTYGGIFRSSDAAGNTVSLFYSSSGNYLTLGTETNYPIQFIVNNSERMRLDTSGNLGVGTTSPGAKLEVNQAATAFPGFKITGSSSPGMQIVEATGVTAHFVNDSAGVYVGSSTSYPLILRTNNTERARIDSSGNLGIGTTAPGATLDLLSATNGMVARFKSSSNYGSVVADNSSNTGGGTFVARKNGTQYAIFGVSGAILGDTSTDVGILSDSAGGGIRFYTNGSPSEKARFDSNGNLGIGTTSTTGYILRVDAASPLFGMMVSGTQAFTIGALSGGGGAFYYGAGNVEAMRIDSSGNLMIGGATASGKLTVDPGSTSGTRIDGLHLPKNLTLQANYLAWQQGANGWRAGIPYGDNTYPLAFYYGSSTPTASAPGTELMRINTSGDLTITGSLRSFASPAFSLAANQFTDIMYIGAGGYGAIMSGILTVYSTYSGAVTQNSYFVNVIGHGGGTGISMLSQGNYSTPATTIVYDRSQVLGGGSRVIAVYNATGTSIAMSYSFSPVGSNNSAAYYSVLYNTGTAGAGTGIPSGDAVYFGQNYATVKAANIIFPSSQSAAADANTLDDYEEGNWTPAISGLTLNVTRNSYTKIGRLVTVSATINIASGSSSSPMSITGIPFPGTDGEFTGAVMLNNVVYTGDPVIYCYPPSQGFQIYLSTSNAAWAQFYSSGLSVNDSIIFSITYIAT